MLPCRTTSTSIPTAANWPAGAHRRRRPVTTGSVTVHDVLNATTIVWMMVIHLSLLLLPQHRCTAAATQVHNDSSITTSLLCSSAIDITPAEDSGYLLAQLPWGCASLFECLVDFCTCVNGTMSSSLTCAPFAPTTTATVVRSCLARRLGCTLAAAQASPWVSNASCRHWGTALLQFYKSTYFHDGAASSVHDISRGLSTQSWDNYTTTCVVDMCVLASTGIEESTNNVLRPSADGSGGHNVSGGVLLSLDDIDIAALCSVNQSYPLVPIGEDEVPGCVAPPPQTDTAYFMDIPIAKCAAPEACVATYCACLGATWFSATHRCELHDGAASPPPSIGTAKTCFATTMSCVLNSALSTYVPGASPLDPNPCLSWSVRIAEDYAAFYATPVGSVKQTKLWQACNASACRENAALVGIASITDAFLEAACVFPGVSARPTFQAYDFCPYRCPNGACAISIVYCSCTASASITTLDASFAPAWVASRTATSPFSGAVLPTFDLSFSLTAMAFATFRSKQPNCTSFDYGPLLGYTWSLHKIRNLSSSLLVQSSNRSSFVVNASALEHNTEYRLMCVANGVLANQTGSRSWSFIAMAPTPVVSITTMGSQLRVSNIRHLIISAIIVDALPSASSAAYAWTCSVLLGGVNSCPSLTNATRTWLAIPPGAAVGTFLVNYTYRDGLAMSSLVITLVAGDLPYVRVLVSGTRVNSGAADMDTFLSSQSINVAAVVSYGGGNAVTYTWSRGVVGGSSAGTPIAASASAASATVSAGIMNKASLISVVSGSPNVINWIRVRVASTTSPTEYGEASVPIVVVEPMLLSLHATLRGSANVTTVVGLQDELELRPSAAAASAPLTPITTASSGPYGTAVTLSFSYYDIVPRGRTGNASMAIGLAATPLSPPTSFSAPAPLPSTAAAVGSVGASPTTILSVTLIFGGVVAARANTTVTILRPSDVAAAASSESAKLASIIDPSAAVAMAANLRGLLAHAASSTLVQYLAAAALSLLARVAMPSDVAAMTADTKVSVLVTVSRSLMVFDSATPAEITSYSGLVQPLVAAALAPYSAAVDSYSFAYDNAALVLDVIQVMDRQSGGRTAAMLAAAIVSAPKLRVGNPLTVSRGGTVLVSVVKELVSTLRSATAVATTGGGSSSGSITFSFNDTTSSSSPLLLNGASLVIPPTSSATNASLLPWFRLDDTAVIGVSGTVLSSNPFGTTSSTASSVVVVELILTSAGGSPSVLPVSSLAADQAWIISVPNAAQGAVCGFYDEALGAWSTRGVTTNSSGGFSSGASLILQCRTTHLSAFGGITPSSAVRSSSDVSVWICALSAVVTLLLAVL